MKKTVFFNEDNYTYKNLQYNSLQIDKLKKKIGKRVNIILLDSQIFIKSYIGVNRDIESYIENEFLGKINSNIKALIHYNYLKKFKKLYVYFINDGGNIENLVKDMTNLQVTPVQFIIQNYVRKKLSNSLKYIIVARIKNNIHIIHCEEKVIINCEVMDEVNFDINSIFNEGLNNFQVVIDKNFLCQLYRNEELVDKVTTLDIGGYLDEKIFKV